MRCWWDQLEFPWTIVVLLRQPQLPTTRLKDHRKFHSDGSCLWCEDNELLFSIILGSKIRKFENCSYIHLVEEEFLSLQMTTFASDQKTISTILSSTFTWSISWLKFWHLSSEPKLTFSVSFSISVWRPWVKTKIQNWVQLKNVMLVSLTGPRAKTFSRKTSLLFQLMSSRTGSWQLFAFQISPNHTLWIQISRLSYFRFRSALVRSISYNF